MKFHLFCGNDKVPFSLNNLKSIPFHVIISRGILRRFIEDQVDPNLWFQNAHMIGNKYPSDQLQSYANECKLLSFSQSTICAQRFIEEYILQELNIKIDSCELWCIKEGATSSIWKVTLHHDSGNAEPFILNVARDYEAGIELQDTSERMKLLSEKYPQIPIVKVHSIGKIKIPFLEEHLEVVVTHNEFIHDAYEVHSIVDKENGGNYYVLVEKFLFSESNPPMLSGVLGKKANEHERDKIDNILDFFETNTDKTVPATININDGDIVWSGEKAVVIAIA